MDAVAVADSAAPVERARLLDCRRRCQKSDTSLKIRARSRAVVAVVLVDAVVVAGTKVRT